MNWAKLGETFQCGERYTIKHPTTISTKKNIKQGKQYEFKPLKVLTN